MVITYGQNPDRELRSLPTTKRGTNLYFLFVFIYAPVRKDTDRIMEGGQTGRAPQGQEGSQIGKCLWWGQFQGVWLELRSAF